ncbi:pentatricopeptide repeat-containing protein At1g80550, mitochondrial [Ricinus communis]|uniref:pentatricopeptide repeat-containing protein At1g80550, mitochondrial n=1 Tax=Ricinus communis TaxID=3988 RepID=UPI0007724052|nr:pentatricopeptide repeat-containing protein At1g80550, mitochondrial [Ricinus communis]|eukprot:XP_015581641.1 pentatricopeptide repeat-containing protein At1g80550, mitochondrial [Ricinus communis]
MLPLIFYSRRLNPNKIIIPLIIQSFSTKPTSHLLSQSPKPHQNPQDFDPGTIFETLSCYSNDWKSALDFFNWVEKECNFNHTTDTFNRMIDILGKFFEFDLSWDLIERMTKAPCSMPNHATFRILFKRYASAHLVNEAKYAYNETEKFNLKDETSFCNLIDALCEHKHVIESQELCFGNNNGIDIVNKTKIYNMILRGWFKMGWWSKCREFWEEMDQKGVHKDLHSYSIYMDIVCKGGKPWKAVKLYKEMKRKGMKLDVVSYNIVVRAVGLSEGVDFAMRVYREMKELGCMPNVVTYNTIIKLLCETGRVKEAYKMLDDMRKKGIVADVITYHCFFRCLEKPKEILWLFDRMIESGVQPRMDTYVMLMRKFGRWGFLRPVLLVWKKMEEQGCSPDEFAYNALIDALVQKGMLHMARRYEEEMLAKGLSAKPRAELSKKVDEGE